MADRARVTAFRGAGSVYLYRRIEEKKPDGCQHDASTALKIQAGGAILRC